MSRLSAQLLEQAQHLNGRDSRGRPQQANLRRAISTAYYALFRLLIDAARDEFTRGGPEAKPLRDAMARAFNHATMAAACRAFEGGQLPKVLAPALHGLPVSKELRRVGEVFAELQQERHAADYDVARTYKRHEVDDLLNAAAEVHDVLWPKIAGSNEARVFLWSLLLHRQIAGR